MSLLDRRRCRLRRRRRLRCRRLLAMLGAGFALYAVALILTSPSRALPTAHCAVLAKQDAATALTGSISTADVI